VGGGGRQLVADQVSWIIPKHKNAISKSVFGLTSCLGGCNRWALRRARGWGICLGDRTAVGGCLVR